MHVNTRLIQAIGGLLLLLPLAMAHGADEEMVANPLYSYWASHKPGATAVLVEETTFGGEDKKLVPGGVDRKILTHRLLEVTPRSAVVRTVALERTFLGLVEAAPTKTFYPARTEKSSVEAFLFSTDAKKGEEEVKVGDRAIPCKTLSGTIKRDNAEVTYKVWHSDMVPGGIVKHLRTTKVGGEVIAETSITLRSFKEAE